MRRLPAFFLVGSLAIGLAGCLTLMPVSSHVQRGVDFTHYRTYAWGPADALPVSDPRLLDNPFFIDYLHGSIDKELGIRGLTRATSERADLLVHFHTAVSERLEVPGRTEEGRECTGSDCRPTVNEYDAGTLIIDVIDVRSRELIWRGWAEHRLEDMLDDPERVGRRVTEAVQRIMETLPIKRADARAVAQEGTK